MTHLILNYIAINMICSVALIILALLSWFNVLFIADMKKQFALASLIAMTVIMAELSSAILENIGSVHKAPALMTNTIGFSLSPFIAIVLSKAFSMGKGKVRLILTIPVWINLVLVISSPWTGLIFGANTDMSYTRGPLFGMYVFAYLCSYAILIIDSIKAIKYYQCHRKSTFIALLVFTIMGTTIQLIMPYVHVSWLCVTLSLILFYAYFCVLTETQDTVTGLLNRNVYDRHTKSLNHRDNGTVIVFDLDSFKQVNDLYGHQWGDASLEIVGSLIKECFYKMGFCYRIGGDEFCVICQTTDEQQAEDALSMFHHKIGNLRKNSNLLGELPTVSTGYAIFNGLVEGYGQVAKKADAQMYSYKDNRKRLKIER